MTREEAIKIVKTTKDWSELRLALQELVPELRESEDERIRMALCDIVRDMPYMETELRAHGLTVEKAIAYLEKQKEQNPTEPAGKLSKEEYLYQLLIDQLITYSDYEYLTGKKPAWSEEDEKKLELIIDFIYKFYPDPVMKYKLKDWLKSLRLQPHWKPSEEQMDALDRAIPVCMGIAGKDGYSPLISLYEQLKKL